MSERIMGIDLGDVRTGIALSDTTLSLSSGLTTLQAPSLAALLERICALADEHGVTRFVMGLPIQLNGVEGPRAEKVRRAAERLRTLSGREVVLLDERLSTLAATRYLNETDTRGAKRKAVVDTLSAQIILQNYLDGEKR